MTVILGSLPIILTIFSEVFKISDDDNLQSQIKELNQKKREDEINVELDDLIIKNQKKYKNNPQSQPKSRLTEEEKNNKMMMKTLTTLKVL